MSQRTKRGRAITWAALRTAALPALLSVGLATGLAPVAAHAESPSPATIQAAAAAPGSLFNTADRAAVNEAFLERMATALDAPVDLNRDNTKCDPGTTTDRTQAAALSAVNYMRASVGLDPVTFDPVLSAKAQQAAVMMAVNGRLSHYPDSSWDCYTEDGAWAAGHANLASYIGFGVRERTAGDWIVQYMTDEGANNTEAGHRAWILEPETLTMGSGYTRTTNALVVFGSPTNPGATTPAWVSWPTPGYFPSDLEPAGRWSLEANLPGLDLSGADVIVRDAAGTQLPTRIESQWPESLVWHVDDIVVPDNPDPSKDRSYEVTVTGIERNGSPVADHVYTTTLFQPRGKFTWTEQPSIVGNLVAGSTLRVDPGAHSPVSLDPDAEDYVAYRWFRDGKLLRWEKNPELELSHMDVGHTFTVEVTPYYLDYYRGGSMSEPTAPVSLAPAPQVVEKPTIAGVAKVGNVLRVTYGKWSPNDGFFANVRWLRDGKPIPKTNRNRYKVVRADRLHRLAVRVTYQSVNSEKTVVVTDPVRVRR